ncbi:MAG: hypothetical protein ACQGVK_21480 [Myxococcota bacterium]
MAGSEAPHLSTVPATDEPGPEPAAGPEPPERSSRAWVIGLAVALAIVLLLFFGQLRTSRVLEARVETLESLLAAAEERLGAYDRHLEAVRDRVGSVSRELRALEGLVEAGPEAAVVDDSPTPPGD